MKLTKLFLVLASFGSLFVATGGVTLAEPLGKVVVSAKVTPNCVLSSSGDIEFGPYNPLDAGAKTATGKLTVACTQGAAPVITLDVGQNGLSGSYNRMKGTTNGDLLPYEIFQPTVSGTGATTTQWNGGDTYKLTGAAATSIAPVTYTMYGQIPINQDVSVDTYADTVTVTVNL
jgi:Uncharacterized secreted protein